MRRIAILVNGIRVTPGDLNDWNCKGVTWVNIDPDEMLRAQAFEYHCGIISRAFGQKRRAQQLASMLDEYKGQERIVVGHSNGADVTLKALAILNWPAIDTLHLVSAACRADFAENGLNAALKTDRIRRVCVYVSGKDMALKFASTWAGRLLGYGCLGLHGPINVDPTVKWKVETTFWPDFGHSDCFLPENFDRSMELFTE